jgi:hypothetical protein
MDFVQFFISLLYCVYFSAGEKRKFWWLGAVIACITHGTEETATPQCSMKRLRKQFIHARLLVTNNDEV